MSTATQSPTDPPSVDAGCSEVEPLLRIKSCQSYRTEMTDVPASTAWIAIPMIEGDDNELKFLGALIGVCKHFREYRNLTEEEFQRAVAYFARRFQK